MQSKQTRTHIHTHVHTYPHTRTRTHTQTIDDGRSSNVNASSVAGPAGQTRGGDEPITPSHHTHTHKHTHTSPLSNSPSLHWQLPPPLHHPNLVRPEMAACTSSNVTLVGVAASWKFACGATTPHAGDMQHTDTHKKRETHTHSHSHTHTLSLSLSHTHTHSLSLLSGFRC